MLLCSLPWQHPPLDLVANHNGSTCHKKDQRQSITNTATTLTDVFLSIRASNIPNTQMALPPAKSASYFAVN